MLAILPVVVLLLLIMLALGLNTEAEATRKAPWLSAFLRGAALWGGFLTLLSEGLGAGSDLTREWSAAGWLAAGAILLALPATRRGIRRAVRAACRPGPRGWGLELLVLSGIAGVATALLALAFLSPPNNVDSLLYHMPRVAHWAQAGNLDHYPTAYVNQLVMPVWAETAILQLYLLSGTDRLSALVQWGAMAGSLLGIAALVRRLGGTRPGAVLALAFTVSIPMGILQATSTQNDYVAAFWLLVAAHEVLSHETERADWLHAIVLGLSFGLGALTKGTFLIYAIPFAAWYGLRRARRRLSRQAIFQAGLAFALALLLNVPFWVRNQQTFGGFLGPGGVLRGYVRDWSQGSSPNGERAGGSWLVSLPVRAAQLEAQMLARNLITPIRRVNTWLVSATRAFPGVFGDAFPNELSQQLWNHEDTAGNPLHLFLVIAAIPGAILVWRRGQGRETGAYLAASAASFALLPLLVSNGASVDGLRFQLPPVLLCAPVVGIGIARVLKTKAVLFLALGLLAFGLPWVLFNNTRPLIGRTPWTTRVESVFAIPRETVLFAMYPHLREPLFATADDIHRLACTRVGLRIDSSDPEYLFWSALGATARGIEMENLRPIPEAEEYRHPSFSPCAIVCTICGDRTRLHGLPLGAAHAGIKVFWGSGFQGDEDG